MNVTDIPPGEIAARIRAAIGYSGEDTRHIAQRLGISEATLRRRTARQRPSGARSMDELYRIAEACGVPPNFMAEGFGPYLSTETPTADERVDRLERAVMLIGAELAGQLPELQRQLLEDLRPRRRSSRGEGGAGAGSSGGA